MFKRIIWYRLLGGAFVCVGRKWAMFSFKQEHGFTIGPGAVQVSVVLDFLPTSLVWLIVLYVNERGQNTQPEKTKQNTDTQKRRHTSLTFIVNTFVTEVLTITFKITSSLMYRVKTIHVTLTKMRSVQSAFALTRIEIKHFVTQTSSVF